MKPWTERELELLKEFFPKPEVTTEDLMKLLDRSKTSIQNQAYSLGLKKEVKDNVDEEYLERLRRRITPFE